MRGNAVLILVVNCGGSSIKYKLIQMDSELMLAWGCLENIASAEALLTHYGLNHAPVRRELPYVEYSGGLDEILKLLVDPQSGVVADYNAIAAVGHRVVHAGEEFRGPVLIDEKVMAALTRCIELAPLHNPANIMGIRACQKLMPAKPQVAVFDNAFHREIPDYVYIYGLPYEYYEKYGVRRYGFHGISFAYMAARTEELLGIDLRQKRAVFLMLGSGCTANAFAFGKSLDVSTGFTPNEGLIQSSRSGDVDAAAISFIMRKEGLAPDELDDVLYRQSGWLGISGVSKDFRAVEQAAHAGNPRARLAIDAFVYRAKKYVGAYAAAMGGLDLLVFAGGVGEKSHEVRQAICLGLEFLGIRLDSNLNAGLNGEGLISDHAAAAPVLVVNSNEEIYIARETQKTLAQGKMGYKYLADAGGCGENERYRTSLCRVSPKG